MQEYMQLLMDLPQHLFPLLIYITLKICHKLTCKIGHEEKDVNRINFLVMGLIKVWFFFCFPSSNKYVQ